MMTLTIDLQPELEAQLRDEAEKTGIDAGTLVARALEERFQRSRPPVPLHLSQEEAVLFQKIHQGLPEATWQEYHDLIAKRRAETLRPEEHVRLLALSDSIAEANAERLAHLAELARQRKTPLKTLMAQLGIKPRKV